MENVESRMMLRSLHLTERCTYYGLDQHGNDTLHRPNPWEFLISNKYHLVWCNVFKAASTSWMYNFNLLAGYSPHYLKKSNIVPLTLARRKYPRPSVAQLNEALNSSVSFLIVRHPFERLLSAYRDKLQFALPHTFHQKLGNQIIRKYRKILKTKKFGSHTRWPTFSEFVDYLLDEAKASKELDMHWTPITNFCTPCQVKFDIIAKFETLDEDQKYLIDKAGLSLTIKPEWKNSGKGKNTNELLMSYYAQLTKSQINNLFELFKYDFELFDYSPSEYINAARGDESTVTNEMIKNQQLIKNEAKVFAVR
ncbi:unnamed protein product [Diamesa tonsa]